MAPSKQPSTRDERASRRQLVKAAEKNSASEITQEEIFPLLDLPPEIWSTICRYAATTDAEIVLQTREDSTYRKRGHSRRKKKTHQQLRREGNLKEVLMRRKIQRKVQQPGITRTCRAIRNDCLHIFYEHTTFDVEDLGHPRWYGTSPHDRDLLHSLMDWLRAIGLRNRTSMHRIYIQSGTGAGDGVGRLFGAFFRGAQVKFISIHPRYGFLSKYHLTFASAKGNNGIERTKAAKVGGQRADRFSMSGEAD